MTVTGLKGIKKIRYKSTNRKVVTISKKGVLFSKKKGTAKINITVSKGKKKVTSWVKIIVRKKTSKKTVQKSEQKTVQTNPIAQSTPAPIVQPPKSTEKTLVVYFSCSGTTKRLAEYASNSLGADLYEIEPEIPYTAEDIDYQNSNSRSTLEQNDVNARPAIKENVSDMSQYSTSVLGYPIWHGQAPRIISTFLESYDFAGKTIIPFCTSSSSGIGTSDTNLQRLVSNEVVWKTGRRFGSGTTADVMDSWLQTVK